MQYKFIITKQLNKQLDKIVVLTFGIKRVQCLQNRCDKACSVIYNEVVNSVWRKNTDDVSLLDTKLLKSCC